MGFWIRGVAQKSGFLQTPFFAGFWKNRTGQRGAFSKHCFYFFRFSFFEKWDPDIFQKSEISKISSSSHSKNAHIKLNGLQWVFGGWGDAPFIFFMGQMGQKPKNGPPSCLSTFVGQYRAISIWVSQAMSACSLQCSHVIAVTVTRFMARDPKAGE